MFAGLLLTMLLLAGVAVYSGSRRKKKGGLNSWLVSGLFMGSFVGGSSTVGTAQMAYHWGFAAWWFTLGGAIGCLTICAFFFNAFRRESGGTLTIMGMVEKEFGPQVGLTASVLSTLGMFVGLFAQMLAATAVVSVVIPGATLYQALYITAGFMALYIIAGGTRGAGMAGMLKLVLLYGSMVVCGGLVLAKTGGIGGFIDMVRSIPNPEGVAFFDPFNRGVGRVFASVSAMTIGIITTQIYCQAVIRANAPVSARRGLVLSSLLIPVLGALGILVGLWMRANCPEIDPRTALTTFVMMQLPEFPAGVVLGALFITAVGTGAGIAYGMTLIVKQDIAPRFLPTTPRARFWTEKATIVLVLSLAALFCGALPRSLILTYAVFSLGIRGSVNFVPLLFALWGKGKADPPYALASVITAPLVVILFKCLDILPFSPLFPAIACTAVIMGAGVVKKAHRGR